VTDRCLACGAGELTTTPLGDDLNACGNCGLVFFADAQPERLRELYDASYFERYPGDGAAYDDERGRTHEARVRLRHVERRASGRRLLEVGAASGWFLRAARSAGYAVSGIEPAHGAATAARAGGLDVATGFIEDAELEPGAFEVICAWHVLEHLADPHAQLRRLRDALRPSGRLFVEVPNVASDAARRMGAGWPWLDLEHHVSQFTPRALGALLSRAGFALECLDTFPSEAYLPPRRLLAPRMAAAQGLAAVRERRVPLRPHPSRHELIRAVARPARSGS